MLRFRLGSIPVLVHPGHLLFALALGLSDARVRRPSGCQPAAVVAVWIVLVFVSVLFHELGHAVAFRAFGYRSTIQLLMFGGVTTPETDRPLPWGKDVVTTLAGPIFGVAAFLAVRLARRAGEWRSGPLQPGVGRPDQPRLGGVQPAARAADGRGTRQPRAPRPYLRDGEASSPRTRWASWSARSWPTSSTVSRQRSDHPGVPAALRGPELPGADGVLAQRARRPRSRGARRGRGAAPSRRARRVRASSPPASSGTSTPPALRSRIHHLLGWVALKEGEGRRALDEFSQVQDRPIEPQAVAAAFSLIGDDARAIPSVGAGRTAGVATPTILHEWAGALIRQGDVDRGGRHPRRGPGHGVRVRGAGRLPPGRLLRGGALRGGVAGPAPLGRPGLRRGLRLCPGRGRPAGDDSPRARSAARLLRPRSGARPTRTSWPWRASRPSRSGCAPSGNLPRPDRALTEAEHRGPRTLPEDSMSTTATATRDRSINWVSSIPFFAFHVFALVAPFFVPFHWSYVVWALALYYVRMWAVTVGYHRYFAHRDLQDVAGLPVPARLLRRDLGPEGRALVGGEPPAPPPRVGPAGGHPLAAPGRVLVEPRGVDPLRQVRRDPHRGDQGLRPLPRAAVPEPVLPAPAHPARRRHRSSSAASRCWSGASS